MTQCFRFYRTGGPEVLTWESLTLPPPGPGEVTIRQEAVGLNFIDIYYRTGLYPTPLPSAIGLEGAGIVEAIGPGVAELQPGDRVAYAGGPLGAYAQHRNFPAERVVKLPEHIDCRTAAAMMLQGLTAQYLVRRTYRVAAGDTILVHAAAGGVGLLVCQWAKSLGARVIGTVGSPQKAELVRAHGCDHPIVYTDEDFVAKVNQLTAGHGVAVVYDSIGRDTFHGSLDCLRPLGTMVSFGNSSGPVPPVDLLDLSRRGSLFLTRPSLMTYTATRADLLQMADDLFAVVASGAVRVRVNQTYPLVEAGRAHEDLAARRTTGSTILLP